MIGATLSRADQLVAADYAQVLKPFGVTCRQLVLLQAIRDAKGTPSQTDLVNATGIDRSTLATMTRTILKKGLIARKRTATDARAYDLSLTAEGVKIVTKALHATAMIDERLLADHSLKPTVKALAAYVKRAGAQAEPLPGVVTKADAPAPAQGKPKKAGAAAKVAA